MPVQPCTVRGDDGTTHPIYRVRPVAFPCRANDCKWDIGLWRSKFVYGGENKSRHVAKAKVGMCVANRQIRTNADSSRLGSGERQPSLGKGSSPQTSSNTDAAVSRTDP